MNYQTINKTQAEMFYEETIKPIISGLTGLLEFATGKLVVVLASLPVILSLDLFATPEAWWKALTYAVIIDWFSGAAVAFKEQRFEVRVFVLKLYVITGYICVCLVLALPANTFPELAFLYYLQYVAYLGFLLKEGFSVARHWKVLAFLIAIFKALTKQGYLAKFESIKDAIEEEHEAVKKADQKKQKD